MQVGNPLDTYKYKLITYDNLDLIKKIVFFSSKLLVVFEHKRQPVQTIQLIVFLAVGRFKRLPQTITSQLAIGTAIVAAWVVQRG